MKAFPDGLNVEDGGERGTDGDGETEENILSMLLSAPRPHVKQETELVRAGRQRETEEVTQRNF